jgi:hypothetical protein
MTKMDKIGMGLGAALDELAALQLIELHPLSPVMEQQDSALASIKSGLVALRDFGSAYRRFGSQPAFTASQHIQPVLILKQTSLGCDEARASIALVGSGVHPDPAIPVLYSL